MSSPPWCRRRPAVPEDDEGSLSPRPGGETCTTTTASATTPPREALPARPGPPQRIWVRRRAPRPPADTLTPDDAPTMTGR